MSAVAGEGERVRLCLWRGPRRVAEGSGGGCCGEGRRENDVLQRSTCHVCAALQAPLVAAGCEMASCKLFFK